MKSKTTETPWTVQTNWHYYTIRGPAGSILFSSESSDISDETSHANAALIVKSVNEHSALCKIAEAAKDMLAFIEMKEAHQGCMSVAQIQESLKRVQQIGFIETAHHLGCATTTRRVDLKQTRKALLDLEALRK